jgi:hypothetical protein
VGFHIYNSKCIDHAEFRAFFNLWNRGGPNWIHEFKKFIGEENASWLTVRGKKSLSYADIVNLPLSGANAVPILSKNKFSCGVGHPVQTRISVFNRLGSSIRNSGFQGSWFSSPQRRLGPTGLRIPSTAKIKPTPMIAPRRGASSSVIHSDLNGGVCGSGLHGRSNFQNSKFNWTRPRNLQWRPIRKRGPIGPPVGLSDACRLGSPGVDPPAFLCQFCKAKGHLKLFCHLKKSSFRFPLILFPSFESRANSVGKLKFLDHSSWFRSPAEPLIGGPPSYGCFEEFAWVVLLKKSETTPL